MTAQELKGRTQDLAVATINHVDSLPRDVVSSVLGRQLLRSATSVGANYRSAARARSQADMLSKLAIVEEEADETQYWLELLMRTQRGNLDEQRNLHAQFGEIVAIMVKSQQTLRRRKATSK